ncbi:hypothetical protein BLOT_001984, partial [Blomia tropicalis]
FVVGSMIIFSRIVVIGFDGGGETKEINGLTSGSYLLESIYNFDSMVDYNRMNQNFRLELESIHYSRFPLEDLVNAIAQAAINGDIPFNKVDINKPFKQQPLQIPILFLRPEDLYRSTGAKINFKLIAAKPIRIPIFGSSSAPLTSPLPQPPPPPPPPAINQFVGNNNLIVGGHREMRKLNSNFAAPQSNFPGNNNFVHGNSNHHHAHLHHNQQAPLQSLPPSHNHNHHPHNQQQSNHNQNNNHLVNTMNNENNFILFSNKNNNNNNNKPNQNNNVPRKNTNYIQPKSQNNFPLIQTQTSPMKPHKLKSGTFEKENKSNKNKNYGSNHSKIELKKE